MRSLLTLTVALAVVGCAGPEARLGGEYPDKVYTRFVSLSPSTTELVAMLESHGQLFGRTASCDYPASIRNIPIVFNFEPDFDRIVGFQPDVVLVDASVANPAHVTAIRNLGIEVREVRIDSVDEWSEAVWELGDMLMQQRNASRRIDVLNQAVGRARTEPLTPSPRVLVAMGGRQPWVAGTDSFQADLVRKAGGEPVGPPGNRYAEVNPEQILAWNPDVVIVSDDPDSYDGPAWEGVNAFRTGQILGIDADLLLRAGSRVPEVISVIGTELRRISAGGAR